MKKQLQHLKLFLPALFMLTALYSQAQEYTLTTTSANTMSSKASIDMQGATGNPLAIIVATPIGDAEKLNPHPIGAWYYSGKWYIFNTDHATMPLGLKYKVQVFVQSGANQFLHVITKYSLSEEGSHIDEPALNNNPNAHIKILQNHAPDNRPAYYLNKFDAKVVYNAASGKWYIKNVNGNRLNLNTAYNIVITSGGAVSPSVSTTPNVQSPPSTIITNPFEDIPTATDSLSTTLMTPATLPATQKSRPIPLTFNNLNDFADKGLPASASLPFGHVDHVAAVMAQQILKADEQSLPVLLTALQAAGFSVIDENQTVLLKPADGMGQALGIYDFEAVGALKLAKAGVGTSLEKITGTITKDIPQISARQFAELMLQDLRAQADNSDDAYLRFWARLIIELGNSPGQQVDLMDAPASRVNLSILQATLLIRRLQGDFYLMKTQFIKNGKTRPFFSRKNLLFLSIRKKSIYHFFVRFLRL